MKKLSLILAVALLLCLGLAAARAETTYQAAGFTYALLPDGTAELISYDGDAEEVIIPNALDGHPISVVIQNPFYFYDDGNYEFKVKPCTVKVAQDHPYLATIDGVLFGKTDRKLIAYPTVLASTAYEIPQGITSIGDYAFCVCSSLTSVSIPDSVTSIGWYAFYGCSRLTSVSIPDSVTKIGDCAFSFCSSLTSVSIPDSVTSIKYATFYKCSSLTSVSIPDNVTSIGWYAFFDCSSLTSVSIPDSVISIGDKAFADCSKSLIITVAPGSYAEAYCVANSLQYDSDDTDYSDAPTDWLTGN